MDRKSNAGRELSPLARRNVLRAAGVVGAVGLAGCSSITNQTFTASDVSMGETGTEAGFAQTETRSFTNTAERKVFGVTGSATAESKLTVFANEESTPEPTEEECWEESDSLLAEWSDNRPVRAFPGEALLADETFSSVEGDQFDSIPARASTVLVPDTDGNPESVIVTASFADIDFGDRVTDGEVSFDPPVPFWEPDTFLPRGLSVLSEEA